MKRYSLTNEMDRVVGSLEGRDPSSKEYETVVRNLETLSRIRGSKTPKLNSDIILSGLFNLAGILLILNYEQLGVVSSKAFSFVKSIR